MKSFTSPELVMVGGYSLRVFIQFPRFTRDYDFILPKKNGWTIDQLKEILQKDYSIEEIRKT